MREKCVRKPLNLSVHARSTIRSQENAKGRPILFLKAPRHVLEPPTADTRKLVLHTFINHVQKARKGENIRPPGNILDILGASRQTRLELSDPGVQWVSFLLRHGKGTQAARVFSMFLHRGYHFSSQAIKYLCEDASLLSSTKPATVFAEYIFTNRHCKEIIGPIIESFHFHRKYPAILVLGSRTLAKDGEPLAANHHRYILQSIFKVHCMDRRMRSQDRTSAVKALLSVLGDWLQAFKRDGHCLTQADIIILVPQLFSILQKQHPRERPLPHKLHFWVLSLLDKLSEHLSDPLAKITFAEAYLNSVDAVRQSRRRHPTKMGADRSRSIYSDIIRWAETWPGDSAFLGRSVGMDIPEMEELMTRTRILKVLAMDRVAAGDGETALEHIRGIKSLQLALLEAQRGKAAVAHQRARQYILDARIRYTSTIVRVCSHYLRKQEIQPLFLVLSFTAHIDDLATFIRLWKRAIHLVTQKGRWSGTFGLNALLTLLARSVPPLWEKAVVGELLFTPPPPLPPPSSLRLSSSLSPLLEATLRVALLDISPEGVQGTDRRKWDTGQLIIQAQENPKAFLHWEETLIPFIGNLPLLWKHLLIATGDSDEKVRLERSLLSRMARNKE